jgi:hypothetical protein
MRGASRDRPNPAAAFGVRPSRRALLSATALLPLMLTARQGVTAFAAQGQATAQTVPPQPPPPIRFDVIRAGDVIGSHRVDFVPGEEGYDVRTRIDIEVRVLGLKVFTYNNDSTEVWRGGRLVRFDSETQDDDSKFFVRGRAERDSFRIENRNGVQQAPATIMVASYWTPEIARRTELLDPQRGRVKTQQMLGQDVINLNLANGAIQATRYRLVGITDGWVAYDRQGTWVAAELHKKGSDILYRPQA